MSAVADQCVDSGPLLLPEDPPRFGPVTRRLLARLVVALAVVEAVGTLLILVGGRTATAAGTSLVFPGMGFVYLAWPLLLVVTAFLALVALVLWWGAATHFAIPLVWAGSAVGAAALADGPRLFVDERTTWGAAIPLAYAAAAAAIAGVAVRFERPYRAKRARIAELNEYLATAPRAEPQRIVRPPDATDVELLRWCYSVARQPDDDLVGLDWGEQFHSGTQLRGQLYTLCWGLSLYAANMVPNAQAQAEDALARLIAKHTDLRVWRYWRTLNLLGNFSTDPDPMRRDNIMLTGYLGDVLNIYEAATGSDRFDQPGSLTFVWKDGRTFAYDHHSIAAAVEENFDRSRLGFYACEPGWSFALCNVMGAQTLFGHDRLHGTQAWDRVRARWVAALDGEYSTPDGSYSHIKSNHVGLGWDTGEVPGGHYLATGTNRFLDILPDHARRADALERRAISKKIEGFAAQVKDGRLDHEMPAALVRHRAGRSALPAWTDLIDQARRLGGHELADAALDASARQCATGRRWPDRPLEATVRGLGAHMMMRWSAPLRAADLNVRGYVPPAGPVVADAPWDDVLFTEARSPDGVGLFLRLEPFDAVVESATVRFGRLAPGGSYVLTGEAEYRLVADADGTASVVLTVAGPMRFALSREVGS